MFKLKPEKVPTIKNVNGRKWSMLKNLLFIMSIKLIEIKNKIRKIKI